MHDGGVPRGRASKCGQQQALVVKKKDVDAFRSQEGLWKNEKGDKARIFDKRSKLEAAVGGKTKNRCIGREG